MRTLLKTMQFVYKTDKYPEVLQEIAQSCKTGK